MQHTEKYQFNLIEGSDDFSPEPLNENTEKLNAALDVRNCQVYVTNYTGNGEAGVRTHAFPHRPMFFYIQGEIDWLAGGRGSDHCNGGQYGSTIVSTRVVWGDKSIAIGQQGLASQYLCNSKDIRYAIFALLDVNDE